MRCAKNTASDPTSTRDNDFSGRVHERADVVCLRATEKALLCEFPHLGELWVPRSQIHALSDVHDVGDEGILTVRWWWALRAGLAREAD